MKISEIIGNSRKPFVSLEIVPPLKGMGRKELLENIRPLMEFKPPYINITNHRDEIEFVEQPGGSFERKLVRRRVSQTAVCSAIQAEFDVEVVPHIICAGATKEEVESELHDFSFLGMNNILALRGDSIPGEKRFTPVHGGYSYASELVEGIREFEKKHGYGFCIGVGGYPEKHFEAPNIETDIRNLKKKVQAGADYIITQMFFDNKDFYDFEARCRAEGIEVPIIPGLKPLSSYKQVLSLPEAFGIDIPVELSEEFRKHADDKKACYELGQQWCTAQCRDLLAHGLPAVHFYTMGKAENVIGVIRSCF